MLRMFALNLPKNFEEQDSFPAIIAIHDIGGMCDRLAFVTSLQIKGIQHGYVTAFAQAKNQDEGSWNAGACCGEAFDQN